MKEQSALNARQKAYLLALYRYDQTAELENKSRWLDGYKPRPAAEWRWVEYGPRDLPKLLSYDPPLRLYLAQKGLVDKGAGSTWNALFSDGLILRQYRSLTVGPWRGQTMFVQLTRKGRSLARELTGERPQNKSSQLSKGAWRVLAYAYRKHPERVWLYDVWHELRSRMPGMRMPEPIVASSIGKNLLRRGFVEGSWDHFIITEQGRQFYEQELAHYRELYPDVKIEEEQGE